MCLSSIPGRTGRQGRPLTIESGIRCLLKALSEDWDVFEETPLASKGLKLQQVPIEEVQQALRDTDNNETDLENVDLGRWQPDFIVVSWKRKRIAVMDLTRLSDELSVQLEEACRREERKYGPVKPALHHYIREGWTIKILPWVIGIRGLAETAHLQMTLSFLDIPQQKWRAIIYCLLSRTTSNGDPESDQGAARHH
jgi:hypothetical protein